MKTKLSLLLIVLLGTILLTGEAYAATPPAFDSQLPVDGAVVNNSAFTLSVHITGTTSLRPETLSMTIDGQAVPAQFLFDIIPDPYEEYYSSSAGAAVFNASYLSDGVHTVTVTIADWYNTVGVTAWSFTVAAPPQINNIGPADKSLLNTNVPTIKAVLQDDNLDPATVKLLVDNTQVSHNYDATTKTVTYIPTLSEGTHTVSLSAADSLGLVNTKSWSFTVDTLGPVYSAYIPAADTGVYTYSPFISITAKDACQINKDSLIVKLDGIIVPASVKYGGYMDYPLELDPVWVETDKTTAIVEYYASNLTDGRHTLSVSIVDVAGNISTTEWSFNETVPPTIDNIQPADKSLINTATPTITANITDYNLNPASITMQLDNNPVTPSFDPAKELLSYPVPVPLSQGSHNLLISASDTQGNINTKSLTFTVDSLGPIYYDQIPAMDARIESPSPYISVAAKDASRIDKSSLIVKLDGLVVPADIKYAGYWDYPLEMDPVYVETDNTTAIIEYNTLNLLDTTHTVTVTLADINGNTSTTEWSFVEVAPPGFTNMTPAPGSKVTTLTPLISGLVTDLNPLDPASFSVKINGQLVSHSFDQNTGIISYTPANPLPQESYINIDVTVANTSGVCKVYSWQFYVSTYTQEMPVPPGTPNNCDYCHKPQNHPINNCYNCHLELIPRCDTCHNTNHGYEKIVNGNQAVGHGYNIYTIPFNGTFFCTSCHSWEGANPNKVPREHFETMDPFTVAINHKSPVQGCDRCHATTLTREHVLRKDEAGNSITCDTCHANPPAAMADKVKTAVANKDARCEACHDDPRGPHPPHITGLDANCVSCHGDTLFNEKQYHQNSQCILCHGSTDKNVTAAINSHDPRCNSCHASFHGISLSNIIPSDIPLYSGFVWTQPQPAQIWAGESRLPADFDTPEARLVISNRRTDVRGTDVFNWYTGQLAAQGWSEVSGSGTASDNFSITCKKNSRLLTINFYDGEIGSSNSNFLGYRLELLYK